MSIYGEGALFPSTAKHNFPNNHLQYAITWFLMSFSISIIFIFYLSSKLLGVKSLGGLGEA